MKRIILAGILATTLAGCAAHQPYQTIRKGEVASFTGWHLTDDEFSAVLERAEKCEGGAK